MTCCLGVLNQFVRVVDFEILIFCCRFLLVGTQIHINIWCCIYIYIYICNLQSIFHGVIVAFERAIGTGSRKLLGKDSDCTSH